MLKHDPINQAQTTPPPDRKGHQKEKKGRGGGREEGMRRLRAGNQSWYRVEYSPPPEVKGVFIVVATLDFVEKRGRRGEVNHRSC